MGAGRYSLLASHGLFVSALHTLTDNTGFSGFVLCVRSCRAKVFCVSVFSIPNKNAQQDVKQLTALTLCLKAGNAPGTATWSSFLLMGKPLKIHRSDHHLMLL